MLCTSPCMFARMCVYLHVCMYVYMYVGTIHFINYLNVQQKTVSLILLPQACHSTIPKKSTDRKIHYRRVEFLKGNRDWP